MPSRMDQLRQREEEALASGASRATELENRADSRRRDFDAGGYAADVAAGTFRDFKEELGKDVESLRSNQASRGRLDTGFGFEDEDRLFSEASEDLQAELARNAFTAASLDLRNTEGIGAEASRSRDRDLELLTAATDREQARENLRAQKKRRRFGLLGGVIGGGAGFLLGGPAGASLGAKLGGTIGGGI